jgi:hypothetical protein
LKARGGEERRYRDFISERSGAGCSLLFVVPANAGTHNHRR